MQSESSHVQNQPYSLPRDIEVYEVKLKEVRTDIVTLTRVSDGLLFGKVGMDAFLGIIPGIGILYTFFASSWMFVLAIRVKTPVKDLFILICLTLVDMCVGIIPTFGDLIDAFVRVHSWFGNSLIETIDRKLSVITRAKIIADNGEYQDFNALKERLFK